MDPTKRRKSTLGHRYLNGEKREKVCLRTVLPTVTPRGRLGSRPRGVALPTQASAQLKASKEFIVRKQLFSKSPHFSSGKKYQYVPTSRFNYTSPNESQGSYQSDNSSLNVTGVQSIPKVPSPVSNSLATNSHLSSCLDYRPASSTVAAATSSCLTTASSYLSTTSSSSLTTSSVMGKFPFYEKLERPKSPPPSKYEHLMKLERAKIKAPVDLAEVTLMKDLSINDRPDFYRSCLGSSNTAFVKETLPKNFSPKLSSTCVKSAFPNSLESKDKLSMDMPSAVRAHEEAGRPKLYSRELDSTFRTDVSDISGIVSHGNCSNIFQREFDAEKTKLLSFETRLKSFEEDKNESTIHRDLDVTLKNSDQNHNSSFESRLKFLDVSKSNTVNMSVKYLTDEQQSLFNGTNISSLEKDSTICVPNVKKSPSYNTNLPPRARFTAENTFLNTTNGLSDVTLTSQRDTSNPHGGAKCDASEKKLSIINETNEKDSHDGSDLNSTDSFEQREKTIVVQDQTAVKTQAGKLGKPSSKQTEPQLEVSDFSDSDDECVQIFKKFDTAMKKVDRLKSEINQVKSEMNKMQIKMNGMEGEMGVVKSEMVSLRPLLVCLIEKRRNRQKSKTNKENVPVKDTKQMVKSKWFNDLKSENPNLLKTPNPARRSVSRMSFINQSIMTPHSLSVVVNDQLDDLFDD